MSTRITADTIGPLNKKNIEAQFCSDWLKDEIFRVFAELDATRADLEDVKEQLERHETIIPERDAWMRECEKARADLATAVEALRFYGDYMNYSVDYDTSENGVTRRVILYSDQEERNEASSLAGRKAREALAKIGVTK